jgi:ATPase family associated with various cellular activities (AAA)
MNALNWQDGNNNYLAASLEWLRAVLRGLNPKSIALPAVFAVSTPGPAETVPHPGPLARWFGGRQRVVEEPAKLLPAPRAPESEGEAQSKAAAARAAAANMDPPPALVVLAQRFGLTDFERDLLLLCAAMEFDPSLAALCAQAQGSGLNYPTFALALAAFAEPSWEALAPHRPLRYARLIEITQLAATTLTSSPLRADERIVNYLKGLNVLDDRLAALLAASDSGETAPLSKSQETTIWGLLERFRSKASQGILPVVQFVGASESSRWAGARRVSDELNRRLYRLPYESLPTQPAELETLARLWQRESLLLPIALYIETGELTDRGGDAAAALSRFLAHGAGLVLLGVRETAIHLTNATIAVDFHQPLPVEQYEEWGSILTAHNAGENAGAAGELLAGQFNLNFAEIHTIAGALEADAKPEEIQGKLWSMSRELTRPKLDSLAQRLDAKATWEDLALPAAQTALMKQIASQVRERHKVYEQWGFSARMNRGFGISALFSGESGTGKTMAAEVIANDLSLNLYRIDLSAVVSKYIGETEKNLRKLFDAAEQGGAILFFDEADALFGKRSEVKDSHDRYANIEINYLLQRMESFSGLAILATNMKSALDQAFLRRLRFVVDFPFPAQSERKRIWQRALPAQVPAQDLDFDRLSRMTVTGGNISSIALNAAFSAAQSGQPVTMPSILAAARTELRKLSKPFNEAEFK